MMFDKDDRTTTALMLFLTFVCAPVLIVCLVLLALLAAGA